MLSAILVGRNTVQNNPEAITARGNSKNYLRPINDHGDFIHIPDTCKISLLENFLLAYFSSYYRGSSSLDIWLHFHALEVIVICRCHLWSNNTLLPPSIYKWCKIETESCRRMCVTNTVGTTLSQYFRDIYFF